MYTVFHHQGARICKKAFLFLHCMSDMRFKSIKASYLANGVVARVHGNKGRSRKTGLSLKEIQDVVQFIVNYAGVYTELKCVCVCVLCVLCVSVCVCERERHGKSD